MENGAIQSMLAIHRAISHDEFSESGLGMAWFSQHIRTNRTDIRNGVAWMKCSVRWVVNYFEFVPVFS